MPDWQDLGAPLDTPVTEDQFLYLTENQVLSLPTPPPMHNEGNYIVSLGIVVRWLGQQAEALGVEIYPGFAAAELLYDEAGRVRGVATGDMGVTKTARKARTSSQAWSCTRRLTLFAEGCRGSLTKTRWSASTCGRRPAADLRAGHQGVVGDRARPSTSGAW